MRRNLFAATGLDRAAHRRTDSDWLATRLRDPVSRLTVVWRSRNLVAGGEQPRAGLLPFTLLAELPFAVEPVLLGTDAGVAHFAVDLSDLEEPGSIDGLREAGELIDLRQVGARLEPADGHLLAYARAILTWHERHRFCGRCGGPTRSVQAGHLRLCERASCGAEHFPRTDPAVIMLVHDGGERCLLGRQESWPPRVYSTLAGFVEPGESLEDAVAREVGEETGIEVGAVRYHSSQPWPFPSSLMLGFHATATGGRLSLESPELEDARWLSREELRSGIERREIRLPPRLSIARQLIEHWLHLD